MKLPTREEAESYFETYNVPENIMLHCFTVNKVALFLAEKLKAKGEHIDIDIVDRLSLLHDIFKAIVIHNLKKDQRFKSTPTKEQIRYWETMKKKYPRMHETQVFCVIFENDYHDFCKLMQNYGKHDIFTSEKSREEQIVHYADWRVFVDDIIPLQKRVDDLFIRYNDKIMKKGKDIWDKRIADEFATEASIFAKLDILPEDLRGAVQ